MPNPSINLREEDLSSFDLIMEQRRYNLNAAMQMKIKAGIATKQGNAQEDARAKIPPELGRNY